MHSLFKNRMISFGLITLAYLLALGFGASAAGYPNRVITLVVPFPPGGGVDAMARMVAFKLSDAFKQRVVVDNRVGANGTIGTRAVASSAPDGYTLLLGHTGTMSINPSLNVRVGYDPRKDFVAVGLIASMPMALIAHPSFPATSVSDVIALAKNQPYKLDLGTTGSGGYMCAEMFKAVAGVDVTIIRHSGTASLMTSLIGGHVRMAFSVLPPALENIRAGNLRAIAVTSTKRSSLLPDVPTFDESGLAGFEVVVHFGLLAPAGTPKEIVDTLNGELRRLIESDDVMRRIRAEGGDALSSTPAEHAADIDKEEAKWGALVRKLNLQTE